MIKAGIIGATGYGGRETVRILLNHPQVQITILAASNPANIGRRIDSIFPEFRKKTDLVCQKVRLDEFAEKCDVVFMATPNGLAMKLAPGLLDAGAKVVDYSADFRFQDIKTYQQNYPLKHTEPELLKKAVYGLSELNAEQITKAKLIANPGCYPTAVILGVAPLLSGGLVEDNLIVANCLTGASGAGRKAEVDLILSELSGNVRPYKVACHRHQPEMIQALQAISSDPVRVCFIPQLIPIDRGIIATIIVRLAKPVALKELLDIYSQTYSKCRFVRISPIGEVPELKQVVGSNFCDIGLALSPENNTLIVFSCIDNLLKGMAGQAVQNMNLMFGFPEETGLL
ncbi:MAG: N-acetyl-gamma-glutamyl-phosphate reductase [Actinobacteria bacterium]|nr:N-acetyl-gamma-glutamyl-phosphate reductase [Actinomycetota bacterium]